MNNRNTDFNRGAIRPIACYVQGWHLIKSDYGIFLAVSFIGMMIGYLVPFGILLGPMWCGFEICLLTRMAGQRPAFTDLFEGFRYFVPSMLPSILLVTLATGAFLMVWFAYFAATMGVLFAEIGPGNPPGLRFVAEFTGLTFLYTVGVLFSWTVLTAPFLFVFSLIVERGMTGAEALWTSIKALFGNFWGVLALLALDVTVSGIGTMLGCVGWFLVVPLILAADVVAYRQVFPRVQLVDAEDDDEHDVHVRPTESSATAPAAEPASTQIKGQPVPQPSPQTGITPSRD